MIRSGLIEPLIKPLIDSRIRSGSALSRGQLATTALALSALVAVSTMADAARAEAESLALRSKVESTVKPNAHRLPARVPAKVLLERFLAEVTGRADAELVMAPGESPDFLQDDLQNRRYGLGPITDPGPRLSIARLVDRLRGGADPNFRLFGSSLHLSGIPTS
ncbi:MAG: hypothetical protein U1E65_35050 [Myxococcota bacterium]